MDLILEMVDKYMHKAFSSLHPDIEWTELEDNGAVYYMNGKNGTAFDWFVNAHFPFFYMFYNDQEQLGAAKGILYPDGNFTVYVFGDKGHADPEELGFNVEASPLELLKLAAVLNENADDKKIWDSDIRKIDTDAMPDDDAVKKFIEYEEYYKPMIERKELWNKTAVISKKVRTEGWKIGYGARTEPTNDNDSGWYFGAGNEEDEYVNNVDNLELWLIGSLLMYEPALNELINSPYGTAVVRVDHDRFEIDSPGKNMLVEKRDS